MAEVTRPSYVGGLGFDFKWNMGWMHDTLDYITLDPIDRAYHHGEMTFSIGTPSASATSCRSRTTRSSTSSGRCSARCPATAGSSSLTSACSTRTCWRTRARSCSSWAPRSGRKASGAKRGVWTGTSSHDPRRQGITALVRDLNRLYAETPALYACDAGWAGFDWIEVNDASRSVAAFLRKDPESGKFVVAVLNLSGIAYEGYRVGVPQGGTYRELINTDSATYAGANRGNLGEVESVEPGAQGRPFALELYLPPQSAVLLEPV